MDMPRTEALTGQTFYRPAERFDFIADFDWAATSLGRSISGPSF